MGRQIKTETDAGECAAAWFVVLERALDAGDLERAAEAQRRLRRLGYEVTARPGAVVGQGAGR